eukprot:10950588-Alexandrium_andersonii.AAC.1
MEIIGQKPRGHTLAARGEDPRARQQGQSRRRPWAPLRGAGLAAVGGTETPDQGVSKEEGLAVLLVGGEKPGRGPSLLEDRVQDGSLGLVEALATVDARYRPVLAKGFALLLPRGRGPPSLGRASARDPSEHLLGGHR